MRIIQNKQNQHHAYITQKQALARTHVRKHLNGERVCVCVHALRSLAKGDEHIQQKHVTVIINAVATESHQHKI